MSDIMSTFHAFLGRNAGAGRSSLSQQALDDRRNRTKKRYLLYYLGGLAFVAVAGIICFSWSEYNPLKTFALTLLVGLSSFMAASFLGFLFGIPKINENDDGYKKSRYRLNSNLTDISDWLTKIIIGLGLVEFKSIFSFVRSVSKSFAVYLTCGRECPDTLIVLGFTTIVFFFTFGLYFGYNYVRLFLSRLYADADESIIDPELVNKVNNSATDSAEDFASSLKRQAEEPGQLFNYQQFMSALIDVRRKFSAGKLASPDDPAKNQFGGKSEHQGKRISARVSPLPVNPNLFSLVITVEGTGDSALRENDAVIFCLHDTFDMPQKVGVVKDGIAKLEIIAWGAFTVGAVIVSEGITLELDLAALPDAPLVFRNR